MKKYIIFVLIIFAISCSKKEEVKVTKSPKKESLILKSDIMTPEVLWSFGRIGESSVSPDGLNVVYTITYYDIESNKSSRDIYVVPSNGGESKKITNTPENEFNILWRDSTRIGFISTKSGSPQIWEINPDGSDLKQVSNIDGGISGFKYSPTLDKIMYVKSVKLDEDVHDLYPDLPLANARIEDDIMYRHWDSWHDYTYNHIFVAGYSVNNDGFISEGKDIMEGEKYDSPDKPFGGIEQIDWNPNGIEIAYTCKKKTGMDYAVSTNTDIYIYNLETGETKNFTENLKGYDKNPVYSPDGKYLAWESMRRDGFESDKNDMFLANLEKGGYLNMTNTIMGNASALKWSRTSQRSIYFIANDKGTEEIYRTNVFSGEIIKVTQGIHDFQSVERATDKLIAQKVSMSQPAELYIVDIFTGEEEQLTHVNDNIMNQLTMGKVEKRWIKTTDNKDMLTWVIYPPHFDSTKTYPALLYNQGGPQGTVSQFWSYRWNFQMMAANGYIVVAPNRRGVPGFGKEWLEEISKDYGGQNIKDLLSAIDAVAKEPYVDENRLGAVGASYGGFSVYFLAGNHNGRFKAFIAHDGIFNFEQMYSTTEEMWFVNWDIGGPFWDKNNKAAQKSYSFSPHNFVQNWDTPILIVQGGKDYRVPEGQGMAAFNSAIMKGVPAKFLYFPEENHWVLRPQNGILWQRVFFEWLDQWLK
ncbi:MAG: S9 family peptidase [Prolixibacteraceae bacterium]|nr:S9 family peptidase [Prolixibacteraceae bacterium]